MPRYLLLVQELNTIEYSVEANSKDEAREAFLAGEIDFTTGRTLDSQHEDILEINTDYPLS